MHLTAQQIEEIEQTILRRDSVLAAKLKDKYQIDGCNCVALTHLERWYNLYINRQKRLYPINNRSNSDYFSKIEIIDTKIVEEKNKIIEDGKTKKTNP